MELEKAKHYAELVRGNEKGMRTYEAIVVLADRIIELEAQRDRLPRIVCLCGSTRFMNAFFEAGWNFTLRGYIVLSVGVCKHAEHHGAEALGQNVADRLDELHLRKIDLADEVYVLNVGGYIGSSIRKEIEYAESLSMPIKYLEEINQPVVDG